MDGALQSSKSGSTSTAPVLVGRPTNQAARNLDVSPASLWNHGLLGPHLPFLKRRQSRRALGHIPHLDSTMARHKPEEGRDPTGPKVLTLVDVSALCIQQSFPCPCQVYKVSSDPISLSHVCAPPPRLLPGSCRLTAMVANDASRQLIHDNISHRRA